MLNDVQNRLFASDCTSQAAIVLINTLACLAVEMSREGYLDIEPWQVLISKFGNMNDLYIGKVPRLLSKKVERQLTQL